MARFMEQQIGGIQSEDETAFGSENEERKDRDSNQESNQLSRRHPVPSATIQVAAWLGLPEARLRFLLRCVQLGDHGRGAALEVADLLPKDCAIWSDQDQSRETSNVVFVLQILVGRFQLVGLRFVVRKIDLDEDQI